MDGLRDLLEQTAALAAGYYETEADRPVFPRASAAELRAALGGPLPVSSTDAATVVADLAANAEPGLVAGTSGSYFGFVIGGTLPAALAADWLTSTWDQNAGLYVIGPAASVVEEIAGAWLIELLGLPPHASFGFVTGGQAATFTALAAARHHVLAQAGWDVHRDGLSGAPRIRVVVGAKRHGTIDRALRLLGLGAPSDVIATDDNGRMLVDELAVDDRPTIVCAQAGEVNTGAFDPFDAIADLRDSAPNAWLHVDGAFGLWAKASPRLSHLAAGVERADSWSVDAHKWLNVPYDNGIAFTAHPESHSAAFSQRAPYLVFDADTRDQLDWNPEHSRRARGFTVYAAIRALGREGVVAMIDASCASARLFAEQLASLGAEILNDVDLNQVLFRFDTDERTQSVLRAVQDKGTSWMGGTTWDGRPAIRISVSNWQTTTDDVERTIADYAGQLVAR